MASPKQQRTSHMQPEMVIPAAYSDSSLPNGLPTVPMGAMGDHQPSCELTPKHRIQPTQLITLNQQPLATVLKH